MKSHSLGYALLYGVLSISAAMAQELPRLDIEATCKAAPSNNVDRSPFENCMRDETEAQRQIRGIWSSIDEVQRNVCVQESQIGGSPSYVDMLTCMQMAQETGSTTRRSQPPN